MLLEQWYELIYYLLSKENTMSKYIKMTLTEVWNLNWRNIYDEELKYLYVCTSYIYLQWFLRGKEVTMETTIVNTFVRESIATNCL